jgi:GntR family transcriptional regulator, transcriptional repressor for pyruvate dehydrogenase complex
MPLQTIEPRRLYRQIADQLRALIERSEFAVGTRLPPERDLAVQLGVSRPSVREALIALEVEGLVEVRMGSGVYVRQAEGAPIRKVTAEGPLEIIRARQLIEAELAAHAARHMKKPQVAGLREAVQLMEEEAAAGQTPTQGDRLFHTRIAEASNNSALLRVVTELFDERRNPLFEQLGSHFETATSWAAAIAEHRHVIDAIAARSAPAARDAMSLHLSNSHDRFTANWPSAARPAAVPRAPSRRSSARAVSATRP